MNWWAILPFLVCLCNTAHALIGSTIELNNTNIETTLSKTTYSLIYFYRDSCQWCHRFNPAFAHLTALYESPEPKDALQLLKCNGGLNERLVQLFRVSLFPTILILQWDTKAITRYTTAERDLKSLTEFVHETTNVTASQSNLLVRALDDSLYDKLVGNAPSLIVFKTAYLDGWDAIELPIHFYLELALRYPAVRFFFVDVFGADAGQIVRRFAVREFPTAVYVDGARFAAYNVDFNTRATGFAIGGSSHTEAKKMTLDSLQEFVESVQENHAAWSTDKDPDAIISPIEHEEIGEWVVPDLG